MAQKRLARTMGAGQARAAAYRLLESALVGRQRFAERAGLETFGGKRDVGQALGYLDRLRPQDYRRRYERNEIAERVVEALPSATWRGGGELVEDDSPDVVTVFEQTWLTLADRLGVWDVFRRADVLAGLGHYAVILIGAPGTLESELPRRLRPEHVLFLAPYGELDAVIKPEDLVERTDDARFGLPQRYTMKRVGGSKDTRERKVHWTRILHVADGILDDRLTGKPRLRGIWNRLDDLDKVVGSGSEAFWQLVQPGLQLKMDKEVVLDPTAKAKLKAQLDEWIHGFRRIAALRGASLETVGKQGVADFLNQVDALISLISAGSGIPKRILIGSERGELASQQDRSNWDQRVSDRRDQFASPHVVRQAVQRFIDHGALPKPAEYEVRWPDIRNLDEKEIAEVAKAWAGINQAAGEEVVTPNEIRDRVLGLEPLEDLTPDTDVGNVADEALPEPVAARRRLARRFLTKGRHTRKGRVLADPGVMARVEALLAAGRNGGGLDEELARLGAYIGDRAARHDGGVHQ